MKAKKKGTLADSVRKLGLKPDPKTGIKKPKKGKHGKRKSPLMFSGTVEK